MEKETMFICRRMPNGQHTVLEVTPDNLNLFLASAAKRGSQASQDAALMSITNGVEVRCNNGEIWFRVKRPIYFSPTPTRCQLSGSHLGKIAYDAKTKYGGWCIMSERSWQEHGCGKLGTGFGQKYLQDSDCTGYYLSEGMSSLPAKYRMAA
ncbi:MAG: hypothetical protein GOVbin4933_64 [Prokaryotic dsDNA virus sp.]|nr:MAG: hypothetical protein GOVbin4933_64 [Prokaryotic dsDNA virus sp.]|tara:strand:+ start:3171 stop:3626 length:456 start_codon:yes stop_codon:yes gene_type:complete